MKFEIDDMMSCGSGFSQLLSSFKKGKSGKLLVTFVNPFSYDILRKKTDIMRYFDKVFIDGALLLRLHNAKFGLSYVRASFDFSSIAKDVFIFANENRLKVSIVGGEPTDFKLALENLKHIYPDVKFVASRHGFFNSEVEKSVFFNNINSNSPDIVVCGMGTPLQEIFLINLSKNMTQKNCLMFTCGGFITQTALKADFYHPLIKLLGLRWLQRMYTFPHVRKRVLLLYPKFVFKYIFTWLSK